MEPTAPDVVVIGAGAVGATVALELSRAGKRVLVLDAGEGPGAGCSYANAGLLSPSHVQPMTTPANVREGLTNLLDPSGPFRLTPRPTLLPWLLSFARHSTPRRTRALTERLQAMARRSLALHLAYPREGIETSCVQTGAVDVIGDRRVVHEEDATCNTLTYVRAVLDAATAKGASVRWGARVEGLRRRDPGSAAGVGAGVDVLLDGRWISPEHVVVAAGMGSPALLAELGLRLPMQGATGYVIDLERNDAAPDRPTTFVDHRVVVTPFADRVRLAGTLDLGARTGQVQPHRVDAIRAAGRRAYPDLAWEREIEVWRGDRPTTSDGVPVIGESARVPGLVVATGHGMWGLVLAPITAEWVRRGLVEGDVTLTDPTFSPDRFTRRRAA
ncbi:hypothetical protein GCM10022199_03580 [Marihabitans asiaticum]|uniref:D-amino acid dehydrogenase small subunit n=1 Tax=Marihabitans asiaticum TaxID=415218 RepID=A0A560WEB6_9MICO|nr:FAD-dependent oxidoreductase [Marihabitans asiaticum]TWD15968.1 D-amino acid dehydrogenase small subunit [Marihabitans asiaticum]